MNSLVYFSINFPCCHAFSLIKVQLCLKGCLISKIVTSSALAIPQPISFKVTFEINHPSVMQLLAHSTSTWKTIARVKCRQRKKFINHKIMYLSLHAFAPYQLVEKIYIKKFSIVHISFWDDEKIDFFLYVNVGYIYEKAIEEKFSISIMVHVNALSFTFLHSPDI